MRNLFRSGAVFFIIAGISFLAGAITSSGGAVANGVVMLLIGIVIRSKNTK